jgi:hypothetical protein
MHNLGEIRGRGSFVQMHGTTKTSAWHLGRPSQEEIDAFWQKKLDRQPATPRGVTVRPVFTRYGNGRVVVESVYGPFLYENRRMVVGSILVSDLTHRCFFAASFYDAHREQPREPSSITTYRRIHKAGYYLNRLCRRLPIDEPSDPLRKAAKAEAERRFVEEGARVYASNLPPISIQAHKAKARTDVGDRFTTAALRKCNSKIRKAIRRVEKTKAYLHLFDKNEIERLRRLSFQKEVECFDRGLRGAFLKDNLMVPRSWAMHWVQGVYIPMKTPHGWVPKRALPTLDKIEAGNKRDWARLARDLRDPLHQNNKLLVAEVREERHHKLVEVLIRRRVKGRLRLGDHRLMPGQFRGQSDIMELRNRKNDYS